MRRIGLGLVVVLAACGSASDEPQPPADGSGASAGPTDAGTGGSKGTGGAEGTGGAKGTGGTKGTGGAQGTGGASGTGGAQGTGGTQSTGGALGTGGAPRPDGGACGYVRPAGSGTVGTWTKITMPVPFTYAMSLVADPARPNDYYGFLTDGSGTAIHVVKSEDYGATWSVVNTTAMSGDPWGATIDPNPNRDPCEPPTMYTPAGYGTGGLFKSVDGGVTWTQTFVFSAGNNPFAAYAQYPSDTYSAAILPDDPPNHVLVTFHGGCWVPYDGGSWGSCANDAGLGESLDGGATWIVHPPPLGIGASQYLMVVDSSTWLTISQDGASNGIWKTSTAGRVGGVVSTSAWKKVDSATHIHGSFQGLVTTSAIYAPHSGGIKRSIDRGETWTPVYTKGGMSWVAPTALYLYADYLMGPTLLRSAIGDGATWSSYTTTPSGMAGGLGPGTQTVVYSSDGAHHYIVDYNNGGGVWRYVE